MIKKQVKLHIVSKFLQANEQKLIVGFKFCKKSDITIIISLNENI